MIPSDDTANKTEGVSRRSLLKLAGTAGAAAAVAGCLGDDPDEEEEVFDDETGIEDDDTADEEGESLTYATTISPSTIDPMGASDNFENIYTVNVYDSLVNYDDGSPPELVEGLATEWEVVDDTTYEFTLRDDATFHNGDPVTADDVVYSFARMSEMGEGMSWMWDGIVEPEGVTAPDDSTVVIETEQTFAPLMTTLPYHPVVNEAEVEANDGDWLQSNDAGSGPYELVEHTPEERIVLERHDDWWGEWPADGDPFEEVVMEIVPEEGTVTGMMRGGDADLTDEWLSVDSYQELDELDDVSVSDEVNFSPLYVFLHTQREPLDDVHVRRALSYAVDYEQVVEDVLLGNAERLHGPLPTLMEAHNDEVVDHYEFDLDRARDELEQSDYDPEEIELTYTYVTGLTVTENIGLLLQTTLNELGIDLELEAAPWTRITDMVTDPDSTSDMHAIYLSFSYVDADNFLYPGFHSSSQGTWTNPSWYDNEAVDGMLDDARTAIDDAERLEMYEEVQELLVEEAPALYIVNEAELYGVSDRVGGYVDNGLLGYSKAFWRLYS